MKCETPNDTASASVQKAELPSPTYSSAQEATVNIPSYLLAEKLIPVLVDLILQAPAVEKYIIFPEVIHSLGRYMILHLLMHNIFYCHYFYSLFARF